MSKYLIDAIAGIPNVTVRTGTQVVGVSADDKLREVLVTSSDSDATQTLRADALFICIGGEPRTDAVGGTGLVVDDAGFVPTGNDLTSFTQVGAGWDIADHLSLSRRTFPDSSLQATSGEDQPNAVPLPSVRVPCQLRWCTRGWRRSAVSSTAMPPDLTEHAVAEFSHLSSPDRIAEVAEALRAQWHPGRRRRFG